MNTDSLIHKTNNFCDFIGIYVTVNKQRIKAIIENEKKNNIVLLPAYWFIRILGENTENSCNNMDQIFLKIEIFNYFNY